MDWGTYKRMCDRPHVFSRWMLEQIIELIRDDLDVQARGLSRVLAGRPLRKPAGHKGGAATDMFELRLESSWISDIRYVLELATEGGVTTAATRERGLGGFVEAWGEYAGDEENASTRAHR